MGFGRERRRGRSLCWTFDRLIFDRLQDVIAGAGLQELNDLPMSTELSVVLARRAVYESLYAVSKGIVSALTRELGLAVDQHRVQLLQQLLQGRGLVTSRFGLGASRHR